MRFVVSFAVAVGAAAAAQAHFPFILPAAAPGDGCQVVLSDVPKGGREGQPRHLRRGQI